MTNLMLIDSFMHCTLLRSADGMYQDAGSLASLMTLIEPGKKDGSKPVTMTKFRIASLPLSSEAPER